MTPKPGKKLCSITGKPLPVGKLASSNYIFAHKNISCIYCVVIILSCVTWCAYQICYVEPKEYLHSIIYYSTNGSKTQDKYINH